MLEPVETVSMLEPLAVSVEGVLPGISHEASRSEAVTSPRTAISRVIRLYG
jgi:hypothetical protein